MQSQMDSFKNTVQGRNNGQSNQTSYSQGQQRPQYQNSAPANANRGCYYCFDPKHRWVACPDKEQDVKDGKIKVEGNSLRFADGTSIPRIEGMSIKAIVAKYLPTSLLVLRILPLPN